MEESVVLACDKNNDELGTECIKTILSKSASLKKCYLTTDNEIEHMTKLEPLHTSSKQRCDMVVYADETKRKVILTVEVGSSPMLWTERKAIYGAADLLRFMRFSQSSINEVTTFCFPNNTNGPSCIIEIRVEWKDFKFEVYLKRYEVICEGVKRLMTVALDQKRTFPKLPTLCSLPRRLIQLNEEEIKLIVRGGGTIQQYPSKQSIVLSNQRDVFKIVYSSDLGTLLELSQLRLDFLPIITFFEMPGPRSMTAYRYSHLPHNCLNRHEAKQCLRQLVHGIRRALFELHNVAKMCHNDLRLDNVCFSHQFQPILIDLDRCTRLGKEPYSLFDSSGKSCMYSIDKLPQVQPGEKTDYFQLGWVVAWIMNEQVEEYHDREWETQPASIKNNKFITKLIEEGFYDASLMSSLPDECSLKSVLEKR